jgi:hypothetical protein
VVDLARPDDPGADDPGGAGAEGRVLTDPDELLLRLSRDGGADPPLPPLHVGEPAPSARRGPARALVSGARRAVLRLISPSIGDLLGQLERDRHRQQAEIERLEKRLDALERERRG